MALPGLQELWVVWGLKQLPVLSGLLARREPVGCQERQKLLE
jgi:hypothetical protein